MIVTDLTPAGGLGSTMSARMNWGFGVLPSSMIAFESYGQPALPVMRMVVDMMKEEDAG